MAPPEEPIPQHQHAHAASAEESGGHAALAAVVAAAAAAPSPRTAGGLSANSYRRCERWVCLSPLQP